MSNERNKAGVKVVLWQGTSRQEHTVGSYAEAMDLVDERHENSEPPKFYDLATGERLHDNGAALVNDAGVRVY